MEGASPKAAREHLSAARDLLIALRYSLVAVRCSLAAVRCSLAALRLAGPRAFSLHRGITTINNFKQASDAKKYFLFMILFSPGFDHDRVELAVYLMKGNLAILTDFVRRPKKRNFIIKNIRLPQVSTIFI